MTTFAPTIGFAGLLRSRGTRTAAVTIRYEGLLFSLTVYGALSTPFTPSGGGPSW